MYTIAQLAHHYCSVINPHSLGVLALCFIGAWYLLFLSPHFVVLLLERKFLVVRVVWLYITINNFPRIITQHNSNLGVLDPTRCSLRRRRRSLGTHSFVAVLLLPRSKVNCVVVKIIWSLPLRTMHDQRWDYINPLKEEFSLPKP